MRKFLLFTFLVGFTTLSGQTQKDFDEYGELMIRQLTNARYDSIPLIRIRELRDFLRERISNETQLEGEIYLANDGYTDRYRDYQKSMFNLITSYQKAKKRGGKFQFSEIDVEPLPKLADTYHGEIVYLYSEGEVQNEVTLSFDFAWHIQTIVLLGEVVEEF